MFLDMWQRIYRVLINMCMYVHLTYIHTYACYKIDNHLIYQIHNTVTSMLHHDVLMFIFCTVAQRSKVYWLWYISTKTDNHTIFEKMSYIRTCKIKILVLLVKNCIQNTYVYIYIYNMYVCISQCYIVQ